VHTSRLTSWTGKTHTIHNPSQLFITFLKPPDLELAQSIMRLKINSAWSLRCCLELQVWSDIMFLFSLEESDPHTAPKPCEYTHATSANPIDAHFDPIYSGSNTSYFEANSHIAVELSKASSLQQIPASNLLILNKLNPKNSLLWIQGSTDICCAAHTATPHL